MIEWKKQGEAVVGSIESVDGLKGSAVIVGGRDNARGAVLVLPPSEGAEPESATIADASDRLSPDQIIDIACMQERLHGASGMDPPPSLMP